ncbi:hypothetical protein [Achromobacter denitrificans]|uniref:hypothetical protein n=1 Tax=Achromobacter denitrificans TaxID=32002 RepID=UPI0023E8A5A4|nr:hypothetical protein [Achromobacter denitrificans]MDF3849571.1 hypothetical protein [Achromobacter denitrificans]
MTPISHGAPTLNPVTRVFYFELDTGIYVSSEELPSGIAREILHQFHTSPPTDTTASWGPDRIYAPYGITLSPIPLTMHWDDGEIPVYDRTTATWHMRAVKTPRLYVVEQNCFYSGRDVWPNKPLFSLERLLEKFPTISDEPIQAWVDLLIGKPGCIHQFKSSGSVREDLKQRLITISEIAQILYKKWDEGVALAKTNPKAVNPFDYHAYADMLGYHARRVLDEAASLLFIKVFQPWLKATGESIYLDEFSSLIREPNGLKEIQKKLFYGQEANSSIATRLALLQRIFRGVNWALPEAIRTTNNAAKHAFHNSDSRSQLGQLFPTVIALGKPQGKHRKNGLIEYSHSLPQILVGLEDFLIDLVVRVSDFEATGKVDLAKPSLSDHHRIISHNDMH